MRGRGLALGVLGASLVFAAPAAGDASKNVELLKTIPEAKNATAINFLEYRDGWHGKLDVMLVTGRFGAEVVLAGEPDEAAAARRAVGGAAEAEGDPDVDFGPPDTSAPTSTFWQNEDMDVDQDAQARAALARPARVRAARRPPARRSDPNGATNIAGVYVVDARDPEALRLLRVPAAADRPHDDLHQRLPLAVERRPGARARASRPSSAGRSGAR